MKRILRSNWPYLILLAALAAIFAPCFGRYMCFPAPDFSAYSFPTRIGKLNTMLSGIDGTALQDVVELMLPPYVFCNLVYPVEAFLAALAFGWFLRGRGADRAAAAFGGLSFALAGYSLTLFSAGHRGFFGMTLYAVLAFAFLSRAVDGGRPLCWALAACAFAWMLHFQIDFAAVFIILASIYTLCLVIRRLRAEADKKRFARRLALGILIAAAAFAIVAAPIVYKAATKTLGERISQIERESPPAEAQPGQSAEAVGEASGDSQDSKWIFTTNWSLPPDEALEFVAPAVKGRQSGDPESPYWGRLGRAWKWDETHQGFMNFRQHIVYLGAIPLAMALLAVLAFWRGAGTGGGDDPAPAAMGSDFRFEVRFWAAAWVVGLLLAFGRYTPFYRLFYAIPYLSYLRAPVKFVRIVELSTAALAALGATALVAGATPKRALRRLAAVSGILAALLALFAAAVFASPSVFLAPLARLGADASLVAAMKANAVRALFHGIFGFALAAAAAFLRSREKPVPGYAALAVLTVAAAADFAVVERPFAFVRDMEYKYTDRNVVTSVAMEAMRPGAPAVGMFLRDQALKTALGDNLAYHACNVHPRNGLDHAQFIRDGGPDAIFRMLDVTGCGFVLIDADQAAQLPRDRFTPVAGLARRSPPLLVERTANPGRDGLVLARVNNPRPYAQLFTKWSVSSDDALLGDVARQMTGQGKDEVLPVVGGPAPTGAQDAGAATRAEIVSVQGIGGARRTVVNVDTPCDAMLLIHRGHNKGNCASLDGLRVPQYRAGYSETAVFVPAGKHGVEIINEARRPALAAVTLLIVFAFVAGLVREAAAA